MKKKTKGTSRRFNCNGWLSEALELLAREGKAKLRIDTLAESLGVTKGSFYWHFKSRDDFLRSLVKYWVEYSTMAVVEQVNSMRGDARERFLKLMEIVYMNDLGRYDVAVRAWAAQEPQIAPFVKKVDHQRFGVIRALFSEMGFTGDELDMRVRTVVCFLSLELGILVKETKKKRKEMVKLRHAFFTRP